MHVIRRRHVQGKGIRSMFSVDNVLPRSKPVGRKMDQAPTWRTGLRRPALTLIEVVAATMIVGLMAVAALNALGAATRSAESTGNRAVALGLADELMAEILARHYRDPDETPVFGPEGGESGGPRGAFDDVDDYHGWSEQPPQENDGTAVAKRDDWQRQVIVQYVTSADPSQTTNTDQGAKQIRVSVAYRGNVLAEQIGLHADNQ